MFRQEVLFQVGVYIEETLNRWINEEGYAVYTYSGDYGTGNEFFTETELNQINL